MPLYETIKFEISYYVAKVSLDRASVHNAINTQMIRDLISCFKDIARYDTDTIRYVVLTGNGESFSSGADINWLAKILSYTYEQNLKESVLLSDCLNLIYNCKFPTIAYVKGVAIGSAVGIIAACDFAMAQEKTIFSMKDVKIGLVPACIAPYIIKRVGEYKAKELLMLGARFDAKRAVEINLINWSERGYALDEKLDEIIWNLKACAPKAVGVCKTTINTMTNGYSFNYIIANSSKQSASVKSSKEGEEGVFSILEKRAPYWLK